MRCKTALAALGVALVATAAHAQEDPINLTVGTAVTSKYIWNGFDRVDSRGLDKGPLLQPSVEVQFMDSPLRLHVGGSFILNDNTELHETLYGVYVARQASPLTQVTLGYNYYDDRVTKIDGIDVEDVDGHEFWAAMEVNNPVGAKPRVVYKYEIPRLDGADAYWVVTGGLAWTLPLVSAVDFGSIGLDLKWHTDVVYNSGVKVADVEVVDKGFSAWQVGVTGEVKAGGVRVTPHATYQVTLKDSVNDENPLWAGIGVSYAF